MIYAYIYIFGMLYAILPAEGMTKAQCEERAKVELTLMDKRNLHIEGKRVTVKDVRIECHEGIIKN